MKSNTAAWARGLLTAAALALSAMPAYGAQVTHKPDQ